MELDNLGAHCALADCHQLDYLPYKCDACGRTFCQEHFGYAAHACEPGLARSVTASTAPVCPICGQPVVPRRGEDPNYAMAAHIDRGCPKRTRANRRCAHPQCTTRDYAATTCKSCGQTFCVTHRNELDHPCRPSARGAQGSRARVNQTKPSRPKARQSSPSAAKKSPGGPVAFLNAPGQPIGDPSLPPEGRLHLCVHLPHPLAPRYMYFNRRFTAGRILDEIQERVRDLPPPPAPSPRYHLYVVKLEGRGVNLLPHMTSLAELDRTMVTDGDAVVVAQSADGLESAQVEGIRAMSAPKRKKVVRDNFGGISLGAGFTAALPKKGWAKLKRRGSKCTIS